MRFNQRTGNFLEIPVLMSNVLDDLILPKS